MDSTILRRARDLYAVYCASSDGKNYQGLPCPAWDALTEAVRGHWVTVELRVMQLASMEGVRFVDEAVPPNDFVVDHLADPVHALEVWRGYSEAK